MGEKHEESDPSIIMQQLQAIAIRLQRFPPCSQQTKLVAGSTCIHKESERRPTPGERRAKGWSVRPFDGYDETRLCNACAAYWHASLAEIRLRGWIKDQRIAEAETSRKASGG